MSGVYDKGTLRLFTPQRDEQLKQIRVWTLSRRLEIAMAEESVKEGEAALAETVGTEEQLDEARSLLALYRDLVEKVMR
jgi:hypothetical protein